MNAYLTAEGWEPGVLNALNSFIEQHGGNSDGAESSYAVFDFDNSSSVFDTADQLAVFQLMHMAFAVAPEKLNELLPIDDLSFWEDLSDYGYPGVCLQNWVTDVCRAYRVLYEHYGPFSAEGLPEETAHAVQKDPFWMEFAVKMRAMYDLICRVVPYEKADSWINNWFYGMTAPEVYLLSRRSCETYCNLETERVTWKSDPKIPSVVGAVSFSWVSGLSVTSNIRELMQVLRKNGIDVWVCSGSFADTIRAAVDVLGIHDSVTGLLGMVHCRDAHGKYTQNYDYATGTGWISVPGGGWKEDNLPMKARPHREGKTDAISNTLLKKYGHGPNLGFMDSSGDFYFCTEFSSMELVVCINRADRSIRNGGGLIAALALYQRDCLHFDYRTAKNINETLYVLQGRDENGLRTLRSSNASIPLGAKEEQLFQSEENHRLLELLKRQNLSTGEIIQTYSVKTSAADERNPLGLAYGFLTDFRGYRHY